MHALSTPADLDAVLQDMAGRQVVLLGEASHGTHEFYTWRTAISQALVRDHGFSFVAVEGDWPDGYRINRFVKGYQDAGEDIVDVLDDFNRWPTWMWANWETAAFAEWLRAYNPSRPPDEKAGFYGLDVYSLWNSMKIMLEYLEDRDTQAARSVKDAVRCFEPFWEDEQVYTRTAVRDLDCRDELLALLRDVRRSAWSMDGDREAGLNVEQNAAAAVHAEAYYRTLTQFDGASWNLREHHMMETLQRLLSFHGEKAKGIVWAHNTHVGDARATPMRDSGLVTIGQMARQVYGEENVYVLGFATYKGTVIAGRSWGADTELMEVPEARKDSIEAMLHRTHQEKGFLLLGPGDGGPYDRIISHRAIGVVYDPAGEQTGNYVPSQLSRRYDALIYLDDTRALHPLRLYPDRNKLPDTYPFSV